MEILKNLAYAGLGLLESTDSKLKEQFMELIKKGKESDQSGKYLIEDFFKGIEELDTTAKKKYNESLTTLEGLIEKMKVKAEDEV
tara:strand:+ start:2326 stop:2580 length:255 start_codon:yes stop_codon:yes gene_type:complete